MFLDTNYVCLNMNHNIHTYSCFRAPHPVSASYTLQSVMWLKHGTCLHSLHSCVDTHVIVQMYECPPPGS